jgi:hypothetical protein
VPVALVAPTAPERDPLLTYEAAVHLASDSETGSELTNEQLAAPLRRGEFLGRCGVPDAMKITVKIVVRRGRAIGLSVYTMPNDAAVSSCVAAAVRSLTWPESERFDALTTQY